MNIAVFVILLIASAFFSGSETAFLSLDKIRLKQIERSDHPSARRVVKLLTDPHKLLITILIGNTLVNIAAAAVLADFLYRIIGEKGIGLSIVAMTIIVLIFGEVTPKMFALAHGERFTFFASVPIRILEMVLAPIRIVLSNISYTIVRGLGLKVSTERPGITEQDIRSLISLGEEKGIFKESEKDMIDSILEFKELNAADIMSPRIDIVALDLTMDRDDLIREIKESQNSRLPAYVHTLDNIVGIIHAKDFLLDTRAPIKNLIKRPFFAPESMRIDDLLQELQKRHMHMAVVTDEYGVTSGVVTIEDILEEIVGEIRDEFDLEVPKIRKIDQKSYEVSGQAHIDQVNEEIGLDIETDEVDTIGGYIILQMGKIPQGGDRIEIDGFTVTVDDVSKNRITSLTIEKPENGPEM